MIHSRIERFNKVDSELRPIIASGLVGDIYPIRSNAKKWAVAKHTLVHSGRKHPRITASRILNKPGDLAGSDEFTAVDTAFTEFTKASLALQRLGEDSFEWTADDVVQKLNELFATGSNLDQRNTALKISVDALVALKDQRAEESRKSKRTAAQSVQVQIKPYVQHGLSFSLANKLLDLHAIQTDSEAQADDQGPSYDPFDDANGRPEFDLQKVTWFALEGSPEGATSKLYYI